MNNQAKRIRLAELTGHVIERPSTKGAGYARIVYPNGCGQVCQNEAEILDYIPDPWTDANDAEAAMYWLNSLGFWVIVNVHKNCSAHVLVGKGMGATQYEENADDWKMGLADAALRACDE